MSGQFRILARVRARSLRHGLAHLAEQRRGLGAGGIVGLVVLLVLGHVAAPALMAPPAEVAAGGAVGDGRTLVAGTAALEVSFWLTALAAAVASFRVMELLFRRRDVRSLEHLPVELGALFLDRTAAALLEAALPATAVSLFFLPLVWRGTPEVAALAAGIAWTGLVATVCTSLAVHLYAGELNARSAGQSSEGGGIYGGPGQVLVYAPALALAVSVVLVLVARLAFGELLAPDGVTRGFTFGMGLIAVAVSVALVSAWRRFVTVYSNVAARFREADLVHYDPPVDYQTSDYARESRWSVLVPAPLRAPYRALTLQYGRRHILLRYSYAVGWFLAFVGLSQWSRAALPGWAVVAVPIVAVAILANPWGRASSRPLDPAFAEYLPLSSARKRGALLLLGLRESLLAAAPYALLVLAVDWSADPAAAGLRAGASLLGTVALGAGVALASRLAAPTPAVGWGAAAATAVLLTGSAFASPLLAGGISLLGVAYMAFELSQTSD